MASMKLIVFNVDQGQCIYIRTPNDYGILFDSGNSSSKGKTSPVEWLTANEAPSLKQFKDKAMITLPDDIGEELDDELDVALKQFLPNQQDPESAVTVITYNSDQGYTWKVTLAGNNDAAAMETLLETPEFTQQIKETDFFITPQHGSKSGFSAELFKAMGKPIANITSTVADEPVDSKYGKQAQGVKFPDGSRKSFETRGDGNITVEMHDDGRFDVWLFTPEAPCGGCPLAS